MDSYNGNTRDKTGKTVNEMPEEEDFVRLKARPVKCRVAISAEHAVAEIVKSTRKHKEKHKSQRSREILLLGSSSIDAVASFTPIRSKCSGSCGGSSSEESQAPRSSLQNCSL
jgi:hypothetical protein